MSSETSRSERSTDRNLQQAVTELQQCQSELDLPEQTVQVARSVYRSVLNEHEDRLQWSITETAVACLYIACKLTEVPRHPSEFADVAELQSTILLRRTRELAGIVRDEFDFDVKVFFQTDQYVARYCDELELGEDLQRRANEILTECDRAGISGGKSPSGWAAAAIYNAVRESDAPVTQKQIADIADVSPVTVRNRYQEQRDVLD